MSLSNYAKEGIASQAVATITASFEHPSLDLVLDILERAKRRAAELLDDPDDASVDEPGL